MFTSHNFPTDDRPEMFPLCHYEWTKLYAVFVRKHGGRTAMQNYVLKRCLRNRQALEEHYRLSLHTSRRQKWYQYLEDRDVGNREALRALTEHMPKVTYVYMLHKVGCDREEYLQGSSILAFRLKYSRWSQRRIQRGAKWARAPVRF